MNEITVGIKTFMRPHKLRGCLKSLVGLGFYEVIVADDGEITPESKKVYEEFQKKLPLVVLRLPFDSGLAYGRNEIVKRCKTPFLLLLDDDQQVNKDILKLKKILLADSSLGGVSAFLIERGCLKCDAHNLIIKNGYLIKHLYQIPEPKKIDEIIYYICDQIPNSTLFRIECLRDHCWDNKFVIDKEHVDFYLSHKILGKWKFAVTPNIKIIHNPSESNGVDEKYKNQFRFNKSRLKASMEYFLKKWKLKGIIEGRKLLVKYSPIAKVKIRLIDAGFPPILICLMESLKEEVKLSLSGTPVGKVLKKFYLSYFL